MIKKTPRAPRPGLDDDRYKHNRAELKRRGTHICGHCREVIDLQLKYPHPLSWSCDHLIPRSTLKPDDPRNWQIEFLREVHARCNSARGTKPLSAHQPTTELSTSIDW